MEKATSTKSSVSRAVKVFFATLGISSLAFGGGFVVLPMLRKTYVNRFKWITDEDMDNYIALAQAAPGTIAGNTSMLIGFQVAGFFGAFLAMLASIIPALVLITVLAFLYNTFIDNVYVGYFMSGMQAGVAAVIVSLVYDMAKPFVKKKQVFACILGILGFCFAFFTDWNVIFMILGAAVVGIIYTYILIAVKKRKQLKATTTTTPAEPQEAADDPSDNKEEKD